MRSAARHGRQICPPHTARHLPASQVEQERARREQAQANEERQRAGMQKRMMWLLHQQVQRYWLLAKMCNDVIVHATTSGLFLYLSPKCKVSPLYLPCISPISHFISLYLPLPLVQVQGEVRVRVRLEP